MKLPKLFRAKIIKKYKMFFIDAKLVESGKIITAYTKNKGGFKKEMAPGNYVYVSFHDDPKRKTQYSVELIDFNNTLSGVGPNLGGKLLKEYLKNSDIEIIKNEASIKDSRLDLKLKVGELEGFGEIKTVMTYDKNVARFPEAETPRGQKHLKLLTALAKKKIPAYLFYIVLVPQAESLYILKEVDKEYSALMKKALKAGVKIKALKCHISLKEIFIEKEIPIVF